MQATEIVSTPRTEAPSAGAGSLRERQSMDRTAQLLCLASGILAIVLFVIGSVWLARLFPPAVRPEWTALHTAQWYAAHTTKVMIGLVFTVIGYGLLCTWGVAMATQTRRKEGWYPTWTYVQLVNMAAGTAGIVVTTMLFVGAAYRPMQIDPQITQTLNDLGWLMLSGTWICFVMWAIGLGMQILTDKTTPVYPRWSGYASIVLGILFTPSTSVFFAKQGIFGWEGLIGLWFAFVIFGVWVLLFTWLTYQNITKKGWVGEQDLTVAT